MPPPKDTISTNRGCAYIIFCFSPRLVLRHPCSGQNLALFLLHVDSPCERGTIPIKLAFSCRSGPTVKMIPWWRLDKGDISSYHKTAPYKPQSQQNEGSLHKTRKLDWYLNECDVQEWKRKRKQPSKEDVLEKSELNIVTSRRVHSSFPTTVFPSHNRTLPGLTASSPKQRRSTQNAKTEPPSLDGPLNNCAIQARHLSGYTQPWIWIPVH